MREQERERLLELLADRYVQADGERLEKETLALEESTAPGALPALDRRVHRRQRLRSWRRSLPALGALAACLLLVILLPRMNAPAPQEAKLQSPLLHSDVEALGAAAPPETEALARVQEEPPAAQAPLPAPEAAQEKAFESEAALDALMEAPQPLEDALGSAPAPMEALEESGAGASALAGGFPFPLPPAYTLTGETEEGTGRTFDLSHGADASILWKMTPVRSAEPPPTQARRQEWAGRTVWIWSDAGTAYLLFTEGQVRHSLMTGGSAESLLELVKAVWDGE